MNQVAQLPAMDAEDIALVNSTKKTVMRDIRTIPQALSTIAMVEVIHEIASHKNCPSAYRQLVTPLLRKLAEDIDQIEADAPKIVLPS
jgi:hypothetical protein